MKKNFNCFIVVFLLICNINTTFAQVDLSTFTTYSSLTDEQKFILFENGFDTIIECDNPLYKTSGTRTVTTCTSMKKRGYGYIGYSKQCFEETYTSVGMSSDTFDFSVSLFNVGISIPIHDMTQKVVGTYSLKGDDLNAVVDGDKFSCIRMRAYLTEAKYSAKTYDNSSGTLISSTTYSHTYRYQKNKNTGVNYYLVARTAKQCNQIKSNKYLGTNTEVESMETNKWKTVSTDSSVRP